MEKYVIQYPDKSFYVDLGQTCDDLSLACLFDDLNNARIIGKRQPQKGVKIMQIVLNTVEYV